MRQLISLIALAALLLAGCQTAEPSVTGTIRTPAVIYGTPGQTTR